MIEKYFIMITIKIQQNTCLTMAVLLIVQYTKHFKPNITQMVPLKPVFQLKK